MKEPVFSMELNQLPGTRPKPLIWERNVDVNNYIHAYLSNEKTKTIPPDIHMRNPMYSDFPYQSRREYKSQDFSQRPQQLQVSQSVNTLPKQTVPYVEDSIDQFQKSNFISQDQPINKMDSLQQQLQKQTQQKTYENQYINRDQLLLPQTQRSSQQSQSQQSDQQKKIYIRNNVFGSREYYQPQYDMDVNYSLYDRPKFKDWAYQDASYKRIVELKNRYQKDELLNNDFVPIAKDYGYGLQGYTKVPIYPSSRPQNIDKV